MYTVPGIPEEGCSIQPRCFKEDFLGEVMPKLPCWMTRVRPKKDGRAFQTEEVSLGKIKVWHLVQEFIPSTFTDGLLCSRCRSRCWIYGGKQNKVPFLADLVFYWTQGPQAFQHCWRTQCRAGSDGGGSQRGGGQFVLRGRVELIPYLLPQRTWGT